MWRDRKNLQSQSPGGTDWPISSTHTLQKILQGALETQFFCISSPKDELAQAVWTHLNGKLFPAHARPTAELPSTFSSIDRCLGNSPASSPRLSSAHAGLARLHQLADSRLLNEPMVQKTSII
ncbi:unnamed protein product [Protopolystoma xenopodis]|uniref:Uncharacterized protein n=1 Tax=Protopolystoma xenopodis TaxID=117903 RepID=A0A3S5C7W0_9PLAT|nr:unnamed protein product [Protopolystoma xenopodis]